MIISTASAAIHVNKRSHYAKFLLGYTSTSAFSGAFTLSLAWNFARVYKTPSISWYDLGRMVGTMMADHAIRDLQQYNISYEEIQRLTLINPQQS